MAAASTVVFSEAITERTSGASMITQSAMQIAPARYFVRLSHVRTTRARIASVFGRPCKASPAFSLWSTANRTQAWVRRVSIICTTVQASTIAARMSERAAP